MKGKKRIKVDGNIAISEEALEKIRNDAVNDYKKVELAYLDIFGVYTLNS